MWHYVFFEIHPALTVLIVALHGVTACLVAYALAGLLFAKFGEAGVPVAPYFVSVTTLLAIVFAFIAVETWNLNKEAGETALSEIEAFERMADLIEATPHVTDDLRNLLFVYAYDVERNEWGRDANEFETHFTDEVLSKMRGEAARLATGPLPPPVAAELYSSLDQLSEARRARLSIIFEKGDGYKWSLLIALSVFTHLAVALVHADRPKARAVALLVFSSALCTALSIMAIHDNPYTGANRLELPAFLLVQSRLF